MKLQSTASEITGWGRNKTFQKASSILQGQAIEQHLSLFYSITTAGTVIHFFPHLLSNTHYGSNTASRGNKTAVWME